jgi:hypothetical protein
MCALALVRKPRVKPMRSIITDKYRSYETEKKPAGDPRKCSHVERAKQVVGRRVQAKNNRQ